MHHQYHNLRVNRLMLLDLSFLVGDQPTLHADRHVDP